MDPDLAALDATGTAEAIRRGDLTPREAVDAAIERIDACNPELNAVIHPLYDKARATADDPALPDGPFRGVPFLIKDAVAHTAGDPYHLGMRFLKDQHWTEAADTYLAAKFRAAGFVIVGKTNTPELATSITTEPVAYGASRNPWNPAHSTGGSSGGSAAAVAARMVPVAHGNDMGGSIRVPSSECGLVGLKPTRARTSLGPDFGEFWGPLTHEGVLTRTVRDAAGVLDCIAGMMPGDPYTAPPPARPFAAEVGADTGRLRVGVRTDQYGTTAPADPACVTAVDRAAHALRDLGHDVDASAPVALDESLAEALMLFTVYVQRDLERWAERTGRPVTEADVEAGNWLMAQLGQTMSASQYLGAVEHMQSWARRVAAWWAPTELGGDAWDVLVTPVLPTTPPRLGRDPLELSTEMVGFVLPWNLTGQPAISLPLDWDADGLPIGVQLIAAYGREDVLLRVAAQLEAALPWRDRVPPIHA